MKMQESICSLKTINDTFEVRIENERKYLSERRKTLEKKYNALQEKYDQEVKAREELEERLRVLDNRHWRHRSQNRGGKVRGQGAMHPNSRESGLARSNNHNNNSGFNNSNQITALRVNTAIPRASRRLSLLPRPSRPSTPIHPENTRESESNSSTLTSSISSTFTQTTISTNESFSSVDSFEQRSESPSSPRTMKPPSSRRFMDLPPQPRFVTANSSMGVNRESVSHGRQDTWANVARSRSNLK